MLAGASLCKALLHKFCLVLVAEVEKMPIFLVVSTKMHNFGAEMLSQYNKGCENCVFGEIAYHIFINKKTYLNKTTYGKSFQ